MPPEWVRDLMDSGLITEVHKSSKFIHGCAVLFPEMVQVGAGGGGCWSGSGGGGMGWGVCGGGAARW